MTSTNEEHANDEIHKEDTVKLTSNCRESPIAVIYEIARKLQKEVDLLECRRGHYIEKIKQTQAELKNATEEADLLKKENEELKKQNEEKDRHSKSLVQQIENQAGTIQLLQIEVDHVKYENDQLAKRSATRTLKCSTEEQAATAADNDKEERVENAIRTIESLSERCSSLETTVKEMSVSISAQPPEHNNTRTPYKDAIKSNFRSNHEIQSKISSASNEYSKLRTVDPSIRYRSKNVIIYGMVEEGEPNFEKDKCAVASLLKDINVCSSPVRVYRLGKWSCNGSRIRPVKVVMDNEDQQNEVLVQFRQVARTYNGLYVREDYTLDEREEIRKCVEQARMKNKSDDRYYWTVHGCPRSELYLRRAEKRNTEQTHKD